MNGWISNLIMYSQFPLSRRMRSRCGPGGRMLAGSSSTAIVVGSSPGGTCAILSSNSRNAARQPSASRTRAISS